MLTAIAALAAFFAFLAALLAFLAYRHGQARQGGLSANEMDQLLRNEGDRIRQSVEEQSRGLRIEVGGRLDTGVQGIGDRQASAMREFRDEINNGFRTLQGTVAESLTQAGSFQKERLDSVTAALAGLTDKHEKMQEALRRSIEERFDAIRTENAVKLDEMRKTVDERLQSTLETRLGESFNRVVEHLERVNRGIGEVQSLAAGVGDLKKVLSNVKVRGTYGEIQLGTLLDEFLSAEQIIRNAQTKDGSLERVEFAVRLPGRDMESEVLLPIDSKFPHEDYERLVAALEQGEAEKAAAASDALEARIKQCARTIRDKYLNPPRTTNFGILFLPTESLYAEILRRPGLFELLQREYQITLTGPTTFTALLNALQMGFRTLAIEKRSSEVWQVLGAVQSEFVKYNEVVDTLSRQLNTAANSVKKLGTRTRAMTRKLRDVEKLPDAEAQKLLGDLQADEDEEGEVA